MRRIAVVTGSRAEFGLLRPVLEAIAARKDLKLRLWAGGAHLLPPSETIREVRDAFPIDLEFAMQRPGVVGRAADAVALGRGVTAIAERLAADPPDVVLVLGDRIEAFAAAAAASVAGVRVAHLHGGDRAEGVADEAMRHAITKLAHLHLAATARSVERIIAMGEEPRCTHLVGSPAIDGLEAIPSLDDAAFAELGAPRIVMLLHPTGDDDAIEHLRARHLIDRCLEFGPVLALHPNHDPGRAGILAAIEETPGLAHRAHLPRPRFIGLLRRVRMIVGNGSAGLIEGAAIPVRCVDIGPRQSGREKPPNVLSCPRWNLEAEERALHRGWIEPVLPFAHPYGDGRTGPRCAEILATFASENHPLAKRNAY